MYLGRNLYTYVFVVTTEYGTYVLYLQADFYTMWHGLGMVFIPLFCT